MKTIISFLILLGSVCVVCVAAAADNDIEVSVALPKINGYRWINLTPPGQHIHVIIANRSNKPQRIWQESNSWAYFALSFEITDKSGKAWVVKKIPIVFHSNIPLFLELGPNESLVLDVNLADSKIWEGLPPLGLPPTGTEAPVTLKMRAVFEIHPDGESEQSSVWTGRVVSKTDDYAIYKIPR
jgi:hypothetical protein